MRFYSFGTDFKYALDRITRQDIYTDDPDGETVFAFTLEAAPMSSEQPSAELHVTQDGRPLITVPATTLDYEVVIQACHIWMEYQAIADQPVWFLALPPGKLPEEFLTF